MTQEEIQKRYFNNYISLIFNALQKSYNKTTKKIEKKLCRY